MDDRALSATEAIEKAAKQLEISLVDLANTTRKREVSIAITHIETAILWLRK